MKTFPLKKIAKVTEDSESYKTIDFATETEVPMCNHVGAFGYVRKNHTHEGVDLYCLDGDTVYAIEDGIIVFIEDFTGLNATPSSPWWNDTRAVHVEGESGVIVYGEIVEFCDISVGSHILQGHPIGKVKRVLIKDKGRPMDMLHLELYEHGSRGSVVWGVGATRPNGLKDPTKLLIEAIGNMPK